MSSHIRTLLLSTFFAGASVVPAAAANALLDAQGNPSGFRTLAIGDAAPDFELPGIDGRTYSLKDFEGTDVLMVLFTSNHCPTSHGIEKRLMKLRDDMRGKSFNLVAINPNHPDGIRIDELGYGEWGDSFEEMKPYAEFNGWDFPYLYDGDNQLVARAYGCLATPHVFIFDRDRKLRYAGRFDDSRYADEATVKHHDARNAIEALLAGRAVPVELTRPHGCSTKWREKAVANAQIMANWEKIPVTLDTIDVAGVVGLRANPTTKFRLFNVWATWCAPCVEEFPLLVSLSRQFGTREFELITLSLDQPSQAEKARLFLQNQSAGLVKRVQDSVNREGRKTNHYLVDGGTNDELIAALDPEWPGPIPHTLLVAPGGKIVWRHNGVISLEEARRAIVEAMSRYYQPSAQ